MQKKNLADNIHALMNSFFKRTKGIKPLFLYLGDEEYERLQLYDGLFCPKRITKNIAFGMEIVKVSRDRFMEVG